MDPGAPEPAHTTSGVADSGCTHSVITKGMADSATLKVRVPDKPVLVQYGNGSDRTISSIGTIGRKEVLVDSLADDTYFAINDMVGGNNKVVFTKQGASVSNDVLGVSVPMWKTDTDMYRLTLTDLEAVTQWPYDEVLGCATHINARVQTKVSPVASRRKMLERLVRLHEIYDHPPVEVMYRCIKHGHWLNTGIPCEEVRSLWAQYKCVACLMGKSNKIPISIPTDVRTTNTGEVISADPVVVDIPGVNGDIYIFLFKDIATQYWHAFVSKTKVNFAGALEQVILFYKSQGHAPKIFRSDSEAVLADEKVLAVLAVHGMTKQRSGAYQHHQNSVERDVQTIVKQISTVLHGQNLLKAKFWDYVLFHVVEMHNRVPNTSTGNDTPQSRVWKLDVHRFTNCANTFNFKMGEMVAVGIRKEAKLWKFDTKRELGVYCGQPQGAVDTHYIFFPYYGNVLERGDVIPLNIPAEALAAFYCARAGIRKGPSMTEELVALAEAMNISADVPVDSTIKELEPIDVPPPPEKRVTRKKGVRIPGLLKVKSIVTKGDQDKFDPDWSSSDNFLDQCGSDVESDRIPESGNGNCAAPGIRSNKFCEEINNVVLNDEMDRVSIFDKDGVPHNFLCNVKRVHDSDNPTLTQALNSPESEGWCAALKEEVLGKLLKVGDCSLAPVDNVPSGNLITFLIFVLKKKVKQGKPDRFKARGCAAGNRIPHGATETYSPTVSSVTCAALQQVAVIDEMKQALVDTVGAFLAQVYPDHLPPVYVKIDKRVAEVCGLNPNQVYRIVKYLYGLPDAGRAYYEAYSGLLVSRGYVQSKFDPCLFYHRQGDNALYAWIHVDDTWIAASTDALLDKFVMDIQSHFEVTVEGIDNYLGVHYATLADGSLKKTQPKLLNDLFEKHGIVDKVLVKTPAPPVSQLPRDNTPFDSTAFLCLLGSLLYVLFSRPDIGFAVSWAASKANNPTVSDWKDLVRVLQYLYQTREKGLIIRKQPKGCPLVLYIYVDASYLLYDDSKAQTGYAFSMNDMGTFLCKSQKQPLVTTSSTHSEMRALFVAICTYIYLVDMFQEIGRPFTAPAVVYEDNQPVVTLLTRERAMPKHSKHFMMLVNFVRELEAQGKVKICKICTWDNYSDIFTKHVLGKDYAYKCQRTLGQQEGEPLLHPIIPLHRRGSEDVSMSDTEWA